LLGGRQHQIGAEPDDRFAHVGEELFRFVQRISDLGGGRGVPRGRGQRARDRAQHHGSVPRAAERAHRRERGALFPVADQNPSRHAL
jgi:hypothetical protein